MVFVEFLVRWQWHSSAMLHHSESQLVGTLSVGVFAFVFSFIVFGIIKAVMGVRVSAEEETEGLDLSEHGRDAYPDFANSSR